MASFAQLPGCDLLVIGSSCEDLSKANPKKGDTKVRVPDRAIHWEAQCRLTTVLPAMLRFTHLGW